MTRLARYEIYECSQCHAQYRHPIWASVSVHMPLSADYSMLSKCIDCGSIEKLDKWILVKELELLTEEEKKKKYEQLMYSLGVGEKPLKDSFFKRLINIFCKSKLKEFEQFKDIQIVK